MKLRLTEDTPGELDAMTEAEIGQKLIAGMKAVARHVYEGRRQRHLIEKGGTGGEIDALEDVVSDIGKAFSKALEQIRAEALKGLDP